MSIRVVHLPHLPDKENEATDPTQDCWIQTAMTQKPDMRLTVLPRETPDTLRVSSEILTNSNIELLK